MEDARARRAVIYCRISQDRTGAGLGVDRQERDCRALAERLEVDVVQVLTDDDVSAYSGKPRPAYRELLGMIRDSRCDLVLAWHVDRLTRRPAELEEYVAVTEAAGVSTQTVQAGALDLSTPSGRMVARQLGAVAAYESEHKGARVRAAARQRAEAGGYAGGVRPFGWKDGINLEPAEAEVVRDACARILAGESLASIGRDLRARGVRGPRGALVENSTLRTYLLRARNAGISVSHGEQVGRGQWEPIVSEETYLAVKSVLTDPGRRTNSGRNRVKWLGSLLYRCGKCGGPMVSAMKSGKRGGVAYNYRCQAGSHVVIGRDETDAYVRQFVAALLRRPDVVAQFTAPATTDEEPLRDDLRAARARLEQVPADYANGLLTGAQAAKATELIGEQVRQLEGKMADRATDRGLADMVTAADPGDWFTAAPVGTQRAILSALLEVTILPRKSGQGRPPGWKPGETYWDHRRIQITPKDGTN